MSTLRDHDADTSSRVAELRAAMVTAMCREGTIRTERVEHAFRTVPRHVFTPEVAVEDAYAQDVVRTKTDVDGTTLSSVSAPWLQAMMLEQAEITAGMRVLEIGSGGYQAALLAELTGPDGQVTTIDIDPDVTDRAQRCLTAAGYPQVTVLCADAEGELPAQAEYDRILVTAAARDVPPSWTRALPEHGRLVMPLQLRGLTRGVALQREGEHWSCREHYMCGFVPLRDAGARHEPRIALHEDVTLRFADPAEATTVDTAEMSASLLQPPVERTTGVTVASNEPFDGLHLWLITTLPWVGRLSVADHAVDSGLLARMARTSLVNVDGGSFAYHAGFRSHGDGDSTHEFVVRAHGPDADRLAEEYVELIRTWHRCHRDQLPRIDVYPATAPVPQPTVGRIIDTQHARVLLQWPPSTRT